jgi:nucleoid-associated protein YgaU
VAEEGKNSPDLTHYRQVKQGDTLPLMVFNIYKDPKYYLEIARVNGLTNFRKLLTGQNIIFPPLEKSNT